MTKTQKMEQDRAIATLQEIVKPGTTVYTSLRHVSGSGMSRNIDLYVMENNEPRWISGLASIVLNDSQAKDGSIKVSGCGMDMGFALVHDLSYALHGNGFECIGQGCPSNEHSNGDRDYTPHMHNQGGYSLHQRWM